MTKQGKALKFLFQIPRGQEDKWRLYCKVLREFDQEPSARIWSMISNDIDEFMKLAEILSKDGEKNNER